MFSVAPLLAFSLFASTLSPLVLAQDVSAGGYSSNSTACTRTYTVIDGDTCDRIGQKTFTSTYQVMAFNLPKAGPDCYTLEIGAKLCLGRYGNDCQLVHRATDTDDCDRISSTYGISVDQLRTNNPSLDCQRVYDGLVLCVAPGTVRPPAPADLDAVAIAKVAQAHAEQEKAAKLKVLVQAEAEAKAKAKAKAAAAAKASKHHSSSSQSHSHKHKAVHHAQHHSHSSHSSHSPAKSHSKSHHSSKGDSDSSEPTDSPSSGSSSDSDSGSGSGSDHGVQHASDGYSSASASAAKASHSAHSLKHVEPARPSTPLGKLAADVVDGIL